MFKFTIYLQNKSFAESSIKSYNKCINRYNIWLKQNDTQSNEINYSAFLTYIKFLQQKEYSVRSINYSINVVKHYYNFLIQQQKAIENPALDIIIKGAKKSVIKDLLELDILDELYDNYPTQSDNKKGRLSLKRDKVIVGMMVSQALNVTALKLLRTTDVDIQKGTIYIPSARKHNSRTLHLKPNQIIDLHNYISITRKGILKFKKQIAYLLQLVLVIVCIM